MPVLLLFCGARLGLGGELLGVSGWMDAGGGEGMGVLMLGLWRGWWMAVLQETNVGCRVLLVLSLYSRYPFCPCISHTHRTNCLLPYFLYPFVPLISHNNDTRASLMLRAAVLCHTQWLVVDLP